MEKNKCDFCGDLGAHVVYPIADFTYLPQITWAPQYEVRFMDDWLACEVCHELIQKNELTKLAYRSNEKDIEKHGSLGFEKDLERYYDKCNLYKLIFSEYLDGAPYER